MMATDKSGRRDGFRTETASGLPDTLVIEIAEAYFARSDRYNQGKTACLFWKGNVEEVKAGGEDIEYDIEENPIMFPCGDGWDTFDNGETVEHPTRHGFTDRSAAGMLIDRVVDKLGIEDELAARGDAMTEAKIWVGLKFLLDREEFDYGINKQTNQPMKTSRLMPTKFLGTSEDGGKGGKGKKAAPAKAAPAKKSKADDDDEDQDTGTTASASASGSGVLDGLDKATLIKLKSAAKKADDADSFAEAAVEIDGVTDNDELVEGLADGSVWSALVGE